MNFKLSLTVLSCLSNMADNKRIIATSVRNTSCKKKLSNLLRSIERWIINALKYKMETSLFMS